MTTDNSIRLLPIKETLEDNTRFANDPELSETLRMTIAFYQKVGYAPPWTGYYAQENGILIGSAGFKGPPVNDTVEIAYGTFEEYQNRGIGTEICRQLVALALQTNPSIKVTARTFLKENFSAKILQKNNFVLKGTVQDPEDGEVWEWYLP